MKLIERIYDEWEAEMSQGQTDRHITGLGYMEYKAFLAGFFKARDMILDLLDEVGPGVAETMGVPRDLGEEDLKK